MSKGRTYTSLGILNGQTGPRFEMDPGDEGKISVLSPSGNTYKVTKDELSAAASMGFAKMEADEAARTGNAKNNQGQEDDKVNDKAKDTSDPELKERLTKLEKELEEERKNARVREKMKEIEAEINDEIQSDSLNPVLANMIRSETVRRKVTSPNEDIRSIAKKVLEESGIKPSEDKTNPEYLKQKKEDKDKVKTVSGGSSPSPAGEEKKKFTAADVRSGAARRSVAARLRQANLEGN